MRYGPPRVPLPLPGIAPLFVLLLLASCDTEAVNTNEVTFNGVRLRARGDARFELRNGRLRVTNIGGSGQDGLDVIRTAPVLRGDFRTVAVDVPEGSRWGMTLGGLAGGAMVDLMSVWHDGRARERDEVLFEFNDGLGIPSVYLEYYLADSLVFRSPEIPLNGARRAAVSGGESNAGPQSVHVVRDGGVIIIVTDYQGSSLDRTDGVDGMGCPNGALIFTPFGLPDPVCTDLVRAVPTAMQVAPPVSGLRLTGRDLPNGFELTDASVE